MVERERKSSIVDDEDLLRPRRIEKRKRCGMEGVEEWKE